MFKNFTKKNYSAHYSLLQFILSTGVVHASQKKKRATKGMTGTLSQGVLD